MEPSFLRGIEVDPVKDRAARADDILRHSDGIDAHHVPVHGLRLDDFQKDQRMIERVLEKPQLVRGFEESFLHHLVESFDERPHDRGAGNERVRRQRTHRASRRDDSVRAITANRGIQKSATKIRRIRRLPGAPSPNRSRATCAQLDSA